MPDFAVEPFSQIYANQIFDLILPIQREEFGVAITREDQPDLEQIADFYQCGAGNFWVATAQNKVVGTISLRDIGARQVALRKMFVHRDWRGKGKGVAQRLLETAFQWARERELSDIYLGTTEKYLAAHRFYEKNGFREVTVMDLPAGFPVMAVDKKFYRYRLR